MTVNISSIPQVECADSDCVLVVFSLTSSVSFREAELIMQKLWQSGDLNSKVVIMVGNKTDLVRTREVPIDGWYFEFFYENTAYVLCPEARFVASKLYSGLTAYG